MRLVTWITVGLLSASLQVAPGRMLRANEVDKETSRNAKGDVIAVGNTGLALVLGEKPSPAEKRATELLAERLKDRAGVALAGLQDKDALRLVIGTSASNDEIKTFLATRKEVAALGQDGYVITVEPGKRELFIAGQSDSGVVAGVGRLMREIRYLSGKIEVPALHIAETPQMPNRGIYLWARKFYFDEPDRLDRYIEELALWGCNGIAFWFEMGMFDTFDTLGTGPDLASQHGNKLPPQEWLQMYRRFYATARRMGMKTGLLMVANDAYRTSPAEMRIEPIIGCPTCYLCPSKPGAVEQMVAWQEQVFKALAPIDIYNIFPADAGGCSCRDCTPWPTKGLWTIARPLAERIHQISPETEIWLDTWHLNHPTFGGKDWKNLVDDVSNDPPAWLAGFEVGLAPHHRFAAMSAEERDHYNKAKQPLMVFPDISMWGNHKGMLVNQAYWKELQNELNDYDPKLMQGGWPYAERWNTDIAIAMFNAWYWNPKKPVDEVLDEWAAFYFGPGAEAGRELLDLLDDGNKDPNRKQKIEETFAKLDASVPEWVKRDWRWNEITASASRFGVAPQAPAKPLTSQRSLPVELPHQKQNAIKTSWPVIGCWFPAVADREPENFKPFLDQVAEHTAYNLLTTSIRIGARSMADQDVHDAFKAAAAYARQRGIGLVPELGSWSLFNKAYPRETLNMVRLQTVDLAGEGEVIATTRHPAGAAQLQGQPFTIGPAGIARVYTYARGAQGIDPSTVKDMTSACRVKDATPTSISVVIPCDAGTRGRQACVLFEIPWQWPDPFSPLLLQHQRDLIGKYADVELSGACLDEFGLPAFAKDNELWCSPHWSAAYAQRTQGRDLLRDMVLMVLGEEGREAERSGAINHYMEMTWQQLAAVEDNFYKATKDIFGHTAFVGTHPSWQPHLNALEVRRNGWDWWAVRRDYGQTDETTPFCVRTALAKKWGKPVGYNMYYSSRIADYERELWVNALAGFRVNYHPVYPGREDGRAWARKPLWRGSLMRGDCRVRLLNFISKTQVDCPVAVIFGHANAVNWAGASYADAGDGLAQAFWDTGFYADLIPTSEIGSSALRVDDDGYVRYGNQKYAAVVLYHPEFERAGTGEFFRKAAKGKTALYRLGAWTRDFNGVAFDGNAALPPEMPLLEGAPDAVAQVTAVLRERGIAPHTPPGRSGQCRLIDGTVILTAGEKDVAGDPINKRFEVAGHEVTVDAIGVAAVRLAADGSLEAIAAGGLKSLAVGELAFELPERIDIALWKDEKGVWKGVLQDYEGPVPEALHSMCREWLRVDVPAELKEGGS